MLKERVEYKVTNLNPLLENILAFCPAVWIAAEILYRSVELN